MFTGIRLLRIRIGLELEKFQLETRRVGASPFQIKGIKNNLNIS